MAIKLSDFEKATYQVRGKTIEVPNLYQSIKEDKLKGRKYLARFNVDGKIYNKILGYSKKDNLTPRSANKLLEAYKTDIEAGYTSTDKINLDKLFELYFETLDITKKWTHKKKYIYEHYVKEHIGKKQIEKIREMDIKRILANMTKKELGERTQKSVLEVLKPTFEFATKNKYLKENPSKDITVKLPNRKKVVTNATTLFNQVYQGIITYYKDNPFYQALFLFGFSGRRKSEILKLKWENIDFTNNYYWIEDTKNSDRQKYPLAPYIKEQLLKIEDDRKGLVFKSPITSKPLVNIDRQMKHLKEYIGISNLSLHYMRHILVSALAEQKIEGVVLSGILGHKDINTINKYLSINHFKSGEIGLKKIDEIIDIEVIE